MSMLYVRYRQRLSKVVVSPDLCLVFVWSHESLSHVFDGSVLTSTDRIEVRRDLSWFGGFALVDTQNETPRVRGCSNRDRRSAYPTLYISQL